MGVRVDHSVGVLESCVAPFTCSLEWTLTSVFVDWFRRDLRVSRVPRGPERGSRVGGLVFEVQHYHLTKVLEYYPNPWNTWVKVGNLPTGRALHSVLAIGPQHVACVAGEE